MMHRQAHHLSPILSNNAIGHLNELHQVRFMHRLIHTHNLGYAKTLASHI